VIPYFICDIRTPRFIRNLWFEAYVGQIPASTRLRWRKAFSSIKWTIHIFHHISRILSLSLRRKSTLVSFCQIPRAIRHSGADVSLFPIKLCALPKKVSHSADWSKAGQKVSELHYLRFVYCCVNMSKAGRRLHYGEHIDWGGCGGAKSGGAVC